MKKILKTAAILAGIAMLITGCERLQPPESPIPLSPDEIMIKEASPVVFFWKTADEADDYTLQVATDEEFENTVYVNSNITDTSLVVDAETFDKLTMYYWQVAASNRAGSSEWSKTNRFFYGTQNWLISPADSTIISSDALTMSWHSYPQTTGYVVRICRNSFSTYNTIWEDTVSDTTCQIPYEALLENQPASYHWSVMFLGTSEDLFWTPSRCFFSRIMPDLDTTYFPFGLGYEWCYEKHYWGYQYWIEPYEEWDYYEFFTNTVTDSFWNADTLCFEINGSGIIKFWDGKAYCDILLTRIDLKPQNDTSYGDGWCEYKLKLIGDTLRVSRLESPEQYNTYSYSRNRLIGIGAFSYSYNHADFPNSQDAFGERLLYFYNGQDTIYKTEDWSVGPKYGLDTTYFPLGLDYEWTYQKHSWGYEVDDNDDTITYEYYDTFSVIVSDSFKDNLYIKMRFTSDNSKPFLDLGNPASFYSGKIETIMSNAKTRRWIDPYMPDDAEFSGDTLILRYSKWWIEKVTEEWTKRIRGIGTVLQNSRTTPSWDERYEINVTDSLILFTTPKGQVWP